MPNLQLDRVFELAAASTKRRGAGWRGVRMGRSHRVGDREVRVLFRRGRAWLLAGVSADFVARPTEYGPRQTKDFTAEERFDVVARDLNELAARLEAEGLRR